MTDDISRFLHRPRKHYAGVRLQEGRLVTDSDFNEGLVLHAEDRRGAVLALLGPNASPNDGFSIGEPLRVTPPPLSLLKLGNLPPDPVTLGGVETVVRPVSVRAGTFYLGGRRLQLEAAEHIAHQREFLQMLPGDIEHVNPETIEETTTPPFEFRDLYFLHSWDQAVTPVEDIELYETALGGESTSARIRRMRRVEIAGGLSKKATNARNAWRQVIARLQADNATYVRQTGELVSRGRLRLVVKEEDELQDCKRCNVDPGGRFHGFDNQALRIMLTSPTTFVWALSNAAPLFRVSVAFDPQVDPTTVTVQILDPLLDEAHWPLTNRVVELIPFGAVLEGATPSPDDELPSPHFRKLAAEMGAFTRVLRSYDPADRTFTIDLGVGLEAIQALVWDWPGHPDAELLNQSSQALRYFYMRLWHDAPNPTDVELPINSSKKVLQGTNVYPVFRALGRRGDYWIAALRPGAPEPVVPFDLSHRVDGVAPHGPRHFYAPLALVHGTVEKDVDGVVTSNTVDSVTDCRPRIQPLSDNGCVTFTVGDGVTSFGDFTSVQDAIDSLPEDGGLVSVRPGRYFERILIHDRHGIVIEGCGEATVIETPFGVPPLTEPPDPGAIIRIEENSHDISISGLTLRAIERHAILVRDSHDINLIAVAAIAGVRVGGRFRRGTANSSIPLIELVTTQRASLHKLVIEPTVRPGLALRDASSVTISELTAVGQGQSRFSPRPGLFSRLSSEDTSVPRRRAARAAMVVLESWEGGCHDVTIRDSIISAFGQVGVLVSGTDIKTVCDDVRLQGLSVFTGRNIASGNGVITSAQSGINIQQGNRITLEDSSIVMEASLSEHAGVVARAFDLVIRGNRIEALTRCFDGPRRSPRGCVDLRALAWGGLQIRGQTVRGEIRGNHIVAGVGHGITLGSVIWVHRVDGAEILRQEGAGRGQIVIRADGTRVVTGLIPPSFRERGRRFHAEEEGQLTEVIIAENRIEQMFTNGISVISVIGLPDEHLIDLDRCRIEQNTIVGNLLRPAANVANRGDILPTDSTRHGTAGSGSLIPVLPFGGIVLGTVTRGIEIRGNVIANNGTSTTLPTNGIFIMNGDGIVIRDNRIADNGGRATATAALRPGIRAGIAVMLAGVDKATEGQIISAVRSPFSPADTQGGFDRTALRVFNNSVLHPEGRALHAVATGPMSIDGNSFGSLGNHGSNIVADLFAVGEIIFVMNVGAPWEAEAPFAGSTGGPYVTPPGTGVYLENTARDNSPSEEQRRVIGHGGPLLFNNNQVTLDWSLRRIPNRRLHAPISFFPVALLALDHLGVEGNQFAFRLRGLTPRSAFASPVVGYTEPVFSHALMIGATVQCGGNRFAESVKKTILSLLAIAELMQIATYNQSTHQIFVTAATVLSMASPDDDDFAGAEQLGEIAAVPTGANQDNAFSQGSQRDFEPTVNAVMPVERIGNQVMFSAIKVNDHIPTLREVSRLFLELLLDRG